MSHKNLIEAIKEHFAYVYSDEGLNPETAEREDYINVYTDEFNNTIIDSTLVMDRVHWEDVIQKDGEEDAFLQMIPLSYEKLNNGDYGDKLTEIINEFQFSNTEIAYEAVVKTEAQNHVIYNQRTKIITY